MMKRFLKPIVGATLAVGMTSFAQVTEDLDSNWPSVIPQTITENVPDTIAASSTATNVVIWDVRNLAELPLQITAALSLTNPAAHTLILQYKRSLDGTTFETATTTVTNTLAGTTPQTFITVLDTSAAAYIQAQFQNTGTNGVLTNLVVKALPKTPRRVAVNPPLVPAF